MSMQGSFQRAASIGGISFPESRTLTADAGIIHDISIPAPAVGVLTTRTDADTGTISMNDSGHTITTGARVDLYWTVNGVSGCRRGVTVGTVSGASVPFDGGDGDDLPAQDAAISVALVKTLNFVVEGDDVIALAAYALLKAQVVFVETADAEALALKLAAAETFVYHSSQGGSNPVEGASLVTVYASNGGASANTVRVGVLFNN